MKKNFSKILWGAVMLASLSGTFAIGTMVMQGSKGSAAKTAAVTQVSDTSDSAKADVTPCTTTYTYYYRQYDGWIQRRLWNRTYGCWAQPKWTNVQRVKKTK